jgi:hypothetical protein
MEHMISTPEKPLIFYEHTLEDERPEPTSKFMMFNVRRSQRIGESQAKSSSKAERSANPPIPPIHQDDKSLLLFSSVQQAIRISGSLISRGAERILKHSHRVCCGNFHLSPRGHFLVVL